MNCNYISSDDDVDVGNVANYDGDVDDDNTNSDTDNDDENFDAYLVMVKDREKFCPKFHFLLPLVPNTNCGYNYSILNKCRRDVRHDVMHANNKCIVYNINTTGPAPFIQFAFVFNHVTNCLELPTLVKESDNFADNGTFDSHHFIECKHIAKCDLAFVFGLSSEIINSAHIDGIPIASADIDWFANNPDALLLTNLETNSAFELPCVGFVSAPTIADARLCSVIGQQSKDGIWLEFDAIMPLGAPFWSKHALFCGYGEVITNRDCIMDESRGIIDSWQFCEKESDHVIWFVRIGASVSLNYKRT